MTHRYGVRAFLTLAALLILSGCGGIPVSGEVTPQNTSATSAPVPLISESGGPTGLILIPMKIEATSEGGGWKRYKVTVALENPGPAVVDLRRIFDFGTVETQEGFTYPVQITDWSGEVHVRLPPKFRVFGALFQFRAAETAHLTKVTFGKFGTVDLTTTRTPTFPTDEPRSMLRKLSEPLETKNARITFKQLRSSPVLGIDVVIENLDKGQDNKDAYPGCSAIDGDGHVHALTTTEAFLLGPGQSIEKTFVFTDNLTQDQLGKAVMMCFNNYDYRTGEGVIDYYALE